MTADGRRNANVSFVVVEMGSRNALGQRFRSNRLDPAPDEVTAFVRVPHQR